MINYLKKHKWKKIIKKSGLFDYRYYLMTYPDVKEKDIDPIFHYINFGAKEGRNPSSEFDTTWYLEQCPSLKEKKLNPLVHYILFGEIENRLPKPDYVYQEKKPVKTKLVNKLFNKLENKEIAEYNFIKSKNLNWNNYFKDNSYKSDYKDPIIDYIKNWKEKRPIINNFFDTNLYLELYPDIKANPLIHFLNNGQKEKRLAFIDNSEHIRQGKIPFNKDKENIIFVSHESSATGAPLLGYNMVSSLASRYNVIHIVIKKSKIHDIFTENCSLLIENLEKNCLVVSRYILNHLLKNYKIKVMILNSVVTFPVLQVAHELKIPTLSFVHEFADYTKPYGLMSRTIMYADKVVVPATIIKKSILKEIKEKFCSYANKPNNIEIFPQGKLPFLPESYGKNDSKEELYQKFNIEDSSKTKIIVASGFFHIRKGADIFISVCRYIQKLYEGECRFIWVGDGYDPINDMKYSSWLKKDLESSELENNFFFLEHQKNLDEIFNIADVFCLTSRMDPFPNVVIDALEADLPIALFKDASGSVEFLENHNAQYFLADYLDTYNLAQQITEYLVRNESKRTINSQLVKQELNFNKYIEKLEEQIESVIDFHQEKSRIIEEIEKSKLFNNNFFNWSQDEKISLNRYVTLNLKQFSTMNSNPLVGFSQNLWKIQNKENNKISVPLYEAIKQKKLTTHECVITPYSKDKKDNIDFKYAIHLHLYYTDLSEVFYDYFSELPGSYDLFITIVDSDKKESVEKFFQSSTAKNVDVTVVENIGRDIGPMIFSIKEKLLNSNYNVIGHFHSKKSLSTDNELGDRWRTYLLDNLIGNSQIAQNVLSQFKDPSVGLVFCEDSHVVDIGTNKSYIHALCDMLKINKVDETPIFPVGNMFWAKMDAIEDLFKLDAKLVLQKEPLPYDGSFMHAIERITPHLIQEKNYKFKTVYQEGTKW